MDSCQKNLVVQATGLRMPVSAHRQGPLLSRQMLVTTLYKRGQDRLQIALEEEEACIKRVSGQQEQGSINEEHKQSESGKSLF